MRALLIMTPIVLVGGFAIQQAVTGQDIRGEKKTQVLAATPDVAVAPAIPAIPAVPAAPDAPVMPHIEHLSHAVTLSEDMEIRIPRAALERVSRLAGDIRLRAEAHADIEVTLNEVMRMLDEHISELDVATLESLEDLGLSESLFADLAASIQASVSVDVDDEGQITVRVPKRRRQ